MPYTPTTGDRLLAAWLSLTSTLWNKRLVSTLTYNEAHVLGILLRAEDTARVCTATTLIAQTRLLKSQMNKLLTTLEGKGFIRRARSEEDKRVILIDDSIVRGTTSDQIVNMLKDAGAKEVHMRISSPPFLWPCYFGIDVPERHQLIAYNHTVDEICKEIGADTLGYLRLERLPEMVNGLGICTGCFTGDYPIPAPEEDIRGEYEA